MSLDIAPEQVLVVGMISSHRVACTVAVLHPDHGDRTVAHKSVECRWDDLGDRARLAALGDVVRLACDSAGVEPRSLFLARSDLSIGSCTGHSDVDLGQDIEIGERETTIALHKARTGSTFFDRELIDSVAVSWRVRSRDQAEQEVDHPIGMVGRGLSCQALLITARRGFSAELAQYAAGLNLRLEGVIPQPVALYRGIGGRLPKHGTTVVIDCGARHTTFLVRQRERLVHLQTFEFGGDHLTRRIADALGVSIDEAERIKREVDVTVAAGDEPMPGQQLLWTDAVESGAQHRAAVRILRDAVRAFFGERAHDLREHGHLGQRGHVHLVGRASALAGLPAVLREVFDLPVILGSGDRNRTPAEEMDNLMVTGLVRVAALRRRAHLAEEGPSVTHALGRAWAWLMRPVE